LQLLVVFGRVRSVMPTITQTIPKDTAHRSQLRIQSGDTVRVWSRIEEKGKTRLQAFEGLVICRKHGNQPGATVTVRKTSNGIGVERIFPLFSPLIDKLEILKKGKSRRSKLYYIREKGIKEIRRKLRSIIVSGENDEKYKEDEEDEIEETTEEVVEGSEEAPVATEDTTEAETEEEKTEEVKEEEKEA
jgi:large subunit ribosomal protein L19